MSDHFTITTYASLRERNLEDLEDEAKNIRDERKSRKYQQKLREDKYDRAAQRIHARAMRYLAEQGPQSFDAQELKQKLKEAPLSTGLISGFLLLLSPFLRQLIAWIQEKIADWMIDRVSAHFQADRMLFATREAENNFLKELATQAEGGHRR